MTKNINNSVDRLLYYINTNEMDLALAELDRLEIALAEQAIRNAIRK